MKGPMKSPRVHPSLQLHLSPSPASRPVLDARLGNLLRAIAQVNALNAAVASVAAELAALRQDSSALAEVYPAYDVIVLCKFNPPRFSSAELANLNRIYILASRHGCEPSDIKASERPSKPLRRRSTRLLSPEQRAAYWAERRDAGKRKREKARLAMEAAWQRELATWPPFVPRNPINSLGVVYRDLSIHSAPPLVASTYLPKANPRTCEHVNMRSYTFSSGEVISLCPDCDKTSGTEALHVPNIFKPTEARMLFYGDLLDAQGLSIFEGLNKVLSYWTPSKMSAIEHARAFTDRFGGKRVKLRSWTEERDCNDEELPSSSSRHHAASTITVRSDNKGVRDYRAREIARAQGDYEPAVGEGAHCKRCGQGFTAPVRVPSTARTIAASGITKNKTHRRHMSTSMVQATGVSFMPPKQLRPDLLEVVADILALKKLEKNERFITHKAQREILNRLNASDLATVARAISESEKQQRPIYDRNK